MKYSARTTHDEPLACHGVYRQLGLSQFKGEAI